MTTKVFFSIFIFLSLPGICFADISGLIGVATPPPPKEGLIDSNKLNFDNGKKSPSQAAAGEVKTPEKKRPIGKDWKILGDSEVKAATVYYDGQTQTSHPVAYKQKDIKPLTHSKTPDHVTFYLDDTETTTVTSPQTTYHGKKPFPVSEQSTAGTSWSPGTGYGPTGNKKPAPSTKGGEQIILTKSWELISSVQSTVSSEMTTLYVAAVPTAFLVYQFFKTVSLGAVRYASPALALIPPQVVNDALETVKQSIQSPDTYVVPFDDKVSLQDLRDFYDLDKETQIEIIKSDREFRDYAKEVAESIRQQQWEKCANNPLCS